MTAPERLHFSDLFGISFVGGLLAALVIAISVVLWSSILSGFHVPIFLIALLPAALGSVVFNAGFLPITMLFNAVNVRYSPLRWVCFPVFGLAFGFLLSVLLVFPAPQTTVIACASGGIAGLGCAWLWGYVTHYRKKFPAIDEAEGRFLFAPSWISGKERLDVH